MAERKRKTITQDHFEERICIKAEHIRGKLTPKQFHDLRDECLREFRELYGEFEIVQWPREPDVSSGR